MIVTVKIPEAVAKSFGETVEDVAQAALESMALEGYRSGKLTHFQVRTMLRLSSWYEAETFLRERGAPLDYSLEDLEEDRSNFAAFLKTV